MDLTHKTINKLIQEAELPAFAVFDFDNTCILNDITEATLHYLARNNLFRDKNLLGNEFKDASGEAYSKAVFNNYYDLLEKGNIKEAYEFISTILSGFSLDEISLIVNKVLDFEGTDIATYTLFDREIAKGIKPKEQVIELINLLESKDIKVWIITSSIKLLVKELVQRFHIKAEVIGVRSTIVDGKFTSQLERPTPIIGGKVESIKKFIDPDKQPILGIGDSINDLPMLEYCKIKVIVNQNNALTAKAKENNWFIIT